MAYSRVDMKLLTSAVLLIALAFELNADPVTYVYTGNDFTDVSGNVTSSDYVTISFTTGASLPDNLDPNAIALGYGVNPVGTNIPGLLAIQTCNQLICMEGTADVYTAFVHTNATGNITGWEFGSGTNDGSIINSCYGYFGCSEDETAPETLTIGVPEIGSGTVYTPGTWTPVPEPSSFGVILIGVLLIASRVKNHADRPWAALRAGPKLRSNSDLAVLNGEATKSLLDAESRVY